MAAGGLACHHRGGGVVGSGLMRDLLVTMVKVNRSGLLEGLLVTMVEVEVGSGLMKEDLMVIMVEVEVGPGLMADLLVTNVEVFQIDMRHFDKR